jgi:dTDP-L-rhamnose 4-epimerase
VVSVRRVLVTGGAGFIGSHVVDALVERGVETVVLDTAGARPRPGVDALCADLRDIDAVERALRGIDAVSHQAAMVGLGLDLGDMPEFVSHNDAGTAALLTAIHRTRSARRLVLASSMVVYGEGRFRCVVHGDVRPTPRSRERLQAGLFEPLCPSCGLDLEPLAVDEDARLDPRNVYAATKVHQEHLCSVFAREAGTSLTILRYHNVYGSRMPRDTPYAGVASIFRSALAAGRAPRVFEDGRQIRDFVHVHDVARANVLALLADHPVSGSFNVASGVPHTVGEMAGALASASGPYAPAPVITGEFRLGDVRHVFASPDRAAAELGFRAERPFVDGIRAFALDRLVEGPATDARQRSSMRRNGTPAIHR